jgi:hypothetical protein
MEETFINEHGNVDARLRVVFDNGTESNLLMRSLKRRSNKTQLAGGSSSRLLSGGVLSVAWAQPGPTKAPCSFVPDNSRASSERCDGSGRAL